MALEKVLFPMMGKIVSVDVKVGDKVAQDQPLATFEAMKMQMKLPSPCAGVVAEIAISAGQSVEADQVFGTVEKG
ncbi:MAG: acetyl-CoA carboxylase biotin carboxyl carrier protein subunit [Deltaproteobacteria bacterium]|nr:acetyl-CoA carboxylase biotin carboxyl carrier protein subunit [Deltaproteobacteria bacterium]